MRILVVEDEAVMADGLMQALKQAGHALDWVSNGEMADKALSQDVYNMVVLDLGLPKMDGFQVLQRLRQRNATLPVLILSAWDSIEDRVKGLDLGANDYLTKPFDLAEFEARVRALLRREWTGNANSYFCGRVHLDPIGHRVLVANVPLDLSARELCIMEMMLQRAGRVVDKEQLLEHIYGWDEEASYNAVEIIIHRLRKKLDAHGITIRTIRGLGYLLESPQDA
jgi:two-component system OmpR family response regulator